MRAAPGPLDARVRDLIVAETRGYPLALLELPRGLTPAELAGGFGLPGATPLAGRIEDSFARQLDALPERARRLLLVAAADPSGDRAGRAAEMTCLPVTGHPIRGLRVPGVADAGLAEVRAAPDSPGHPTGEHFVLQYLHVLHVLLNEEWEHHRYTVRDLDVLDPAEASGS